MNITAKQYAKAWYELIDAGDKKEGTQKMLSHLYKTGRLSMLSEILRDLEEIEHQTRGIEHATVTTAREISDDEAKKLAKKILKTEIIISKHTNPDLIGGVQIETRNKRWDLTIYNQLQQLEKQLI